MVAAAVVATVACGSSLPYQHLVVWNQTGRPERIIIHVDDRLMYSGLLGTVEYAPSIVINEQIGFPKGRHTFSVEVPGRNFSRSVDFVVAKKEVNLNVMVNLENVQVDVGYGLVLYE